MMRVDVAALQKMAALPAEERKALPVRGVAKAEAEGNRVMNALVLMASGERPEAEKPKARPLTAAEKAEAWREYTASLGEKLRDWGDNPLTWKALETDDLEKFRAELVLVVGLVKDELRSREENAVK
jgi:PAB1-binding protein PBP1